jgi:hypothetical protein
MIYPARFIQPYQLISKGNNLFHFMLNLER